MIRLRESTLAAYVILGIVLVLAAIVGRAGGAPDEVDRYGGFIRLPF